MAYCTCIKILIILMAAGVYGDKTRLEITVAVRIIMS